ncbi:xanthine dehydrogenase family protein subunit M [Aldersonia sp. NBC_00410]|jgi:carbon-monoxide dehydrogenase medium subunit|uniref:FAD binding domain-containing protein n=1 Tax=Aldersonia sp. NBC_00410 TaxID=2975954 RepID=UPI002256ABD0|nr:xanthine dehydrogenase family protein subunit M [Aldersonia sp. NBC_00410]MCX5044268.1 xanthine dehydrogenase family protein subunit M [Aldersonia sp. NBC_00410]
MKPSAFEYHAPETAEEAVALLAELGDEAKFIAGGQSLMPMLNLRLAVFEHLIDLRRLDELRGIELRGDSVWIGAGTTHAAVGRSETVRRHAPLLARATPLIGHFQIRNRGTIGGAIAHADAAAEYPAVALTLDAELEALSPRGRRTIPAAEFFTGMWSTALDEDELLTSISVPVCQGRCGYAIEEFARRSGDFAMAGATVAVRLDADSKVDRARIALFGLGPSPVRATETETDLVGRSADEIAAEEVGGSALSTLESIPSDIHGSAEYRRRVGAAMVARAWQRAVQEASND